MARCFSKALASEPNGRNKPATASASGSRLFWCQYLSMITIVVVFTFLFFRRIAFLFYLFIHLCLKCPHREVL
jgi:hypothetical protein